MSETKFKKGDKVRVRSNVEEPTHGWGDVDKRSVGVVLDAGAQMLVDFPKHKRWIGVPGEMELANRPTKKPAPAKWEPIPADTKITKAELIILANRLSAENARLKARLAKGGK